MQFSFVLRLLVVYYFVASMFNVVSIIRIQLGWAPLIDGNPYASLLMLTLFLLLAAMGYKKWHLPFLVLAGCGLYSLTVRGFIPHINALNTPNLAAIYSSDWVIWLAISINGFGLFVLLLCITGSPWIKQARVRIQKMPHR